LKVPMSPDVAPTNVVAATRKRRRSATNDMQAQDVRLAPERAAELTFYIGKQLDITYGFGSQQNPTIVRRWIVSVDPKTLTVSLDSSRNKQRSLEYIPTRWVMRYANDF